MFSGTMRVEELFQLDVLHKQQGASLFDKEAYQTIRLYFINKKDAKEYGAQHFPKDDRRVNRVIGANEEDGQWTILDPYYTPDLSYTNRINGRLTNVHVDCATVRTPNLVIFLKERETVFNLKAPGLFGKRSQEKGVALCQTVQMKDATHFLFSYFDDADSITFLNGVLVAPRKEKVNLTAGNRNTQERKIEYPSCGIIDETPKKK